MSEDIDSYLASIEEYVFDEKKIVTCSWLSKALGIHSNLSKQLLYTFFEKCPKKEELSVTYLLIGSPENDGSCQISIVKDKDLDSFENNWKMVTSKHIYSVQKCLDLADLNVLYNAQKGDSVDAICKSISAIDFNCIERDNAQIAKLRSAALPVPSKQPVGALKKTVPQPTKAKSPVKQNEVKSSAGEGNSKEKTSVIPSMFKNSKPAENKPNLKNKTAEKAAANNKKTQGIGAFFNKAIPQTNKPSSKTQTNKPSSEINKPMESEIVKEEKKSNITQRHSPTKENKPTHNIVKENNSKKIESPKQTSPKTKTTQTKKKASTKKGVSKKKSTKEVEKEQKKRKRLVVVSDSDSSEGSEEEEEVPRESTPEPQPTIVPDDDDEDIISATPEPATRKRKKKLIKKTYRTPDGYMETKKEYVDVSCSEDEETVPEKKFKETPTRGNSFEKQSEKSSSPVPAKSLPAAKEDAPKNKKTSPHKIKQASLTSFFKKK